VALQTPVSSPSWESTTSRCDGTLPRDPAHTVTPVAAIAQRIDAIHRTLPAPLAWHGVLFQGAVNGTLRRRRPCRKSPASEKNMVHSEHSYHAYLYEMPSLVCRQMDRNTLRLLLTLSCDTGPHAFVVAVSPRVHVPSAGGRTDPEILRVSHILRDGLNCSGLLLEDCLRLGFG
jgi:hypothetical protein